MTNTEQPEKLEITCNENGPYIIKNVSEMISTKGKPMATKDTMALCRCGQSSLKPFCDGTHSQVGFSGEINSNRSKDRKDSYAGERITIHDNRGLCAHAGVCTKNLSSVFRMKQSPWIDADQAPVDEVKTVIDQCPSGALSYSVEGEEPVAASSQTIITVIPNGPYKIVGNVEIHSVDAFDGASNNTRTLCRCGHSKNKPFCDGSHWDAGFEDA